jgi:hypothetical protein
MGQQLTCVRSSTVVPVLRSDVCHRLQFVCVARLVPCAVDAIFVHCIVLYLLLLLWPVLGCDLHT